MQFLLWYDVHVSLRVVILHSVTISHSQFVSAMFRVSPGLALDCKAVSTVYFGQLDSVELT